MGRILAIDYGIKRTGIAVTDPERIISTGLTTVNTPLLMQWLQDYCKKEQVDVFVVGEPKHMDNTPSLSYRNWPSCSPTRRLPASTSGSPPKWLSKP